MEKQSILGGIVMLLFLPLFGYAASPYEAVQQGNALYQKGQYAEAAQQYANAAQKLPEATEIHFNQGNAFYKQEAYTKALEHYERALQTPDLTLQSRTQYNLGNVKYQQALQALQNPSTAMTHLRAAMTYYRDSLEIDPQLHDARYNLELAQRLLHQLQQQPPPQDQQSQQQEQQQAQQQQQQQERQQGQQQEPQRSEQQNTAQATPDPQTGQSNPDEAASAAPDSQSQQATTTPDMTPAEAERLLEALRERAQEADARRQQWQRTRMQATQVDKDW